MSCHNPGWYRYDKRGCRCDGCTEAAKLYTRARRHKERTAAGYRHRCVFCGEPLPTICGQHVHETVIHGSRRNAA